jgi:hypothetical protein
MKKSHSGRGLNHPKNEKLSSSMGPKTPEKTAKPNVTSSPQEKKIPKPEELQNAKDKIDYYKNQILSKFSKINWGLDLKVLLLDPDNSETARMLLGLIAIKFQVFFHLTDNFCDEITEKLTLYSAGNSTKLEDNPVFLAKSYTDTPQSSPAPETHKHSHDNEELELFGSRGPIPLSEELYLDLASTLKNMSIPNIFFNLYACVETANFFINELRKAGNKMDPTVYEKVLKFMISPPHENGTYCKGNIRMKEAHCYVWDSSVGPVQIGIPPETIKTSMLKGEDVPKYYILPPLLFFDGKNFAEVGKHHQLLIA